MDPDERAFRREELSLTRKHNRATVVTALIIAVVSNAVVVGVALMTLRTTATQFELSSRASEYNDIIQGLSSSVGAVEINSIRRLGTFIEDRDNFADTERQHAEATNAVQTLAAYVKEKGSFTDGGLADYGSSHPPVVPPAISRLSILASNPSLGDNSVDLARVDMHGLRNLQEFRPSGADAYLPSVDLRGAFLWKMDLTGVDHSTLRRSFLTCADLRESKLGRTLLEFADLSGANLSDADLSQVRELTSEQLTGVTTNEGTRLPEGVEVPAGSSWSGDECRQRINDMTGFTPGTGYHPDIPCPAGREVCSARLPMP
ncbi:pentapeptide repeat-containing protein [Geodermatophilus obscurus]|nr:pentapeptide repeat-containing protein [Geodermatophilus obscurus]